MDRKNQRKNGRKDADIDSSDESNSNASNSRTYMTQSELMDVQQLMTTYIEKQKTLRSTAYQQPKSIWSNFLSKIGIGNKEDTLCVQPPANQNDNETDESTQTRSTSGTDTGTSSSRASKYSVSNKSNRLRRRRSLNPNDNLVVETSLGDVINFDDDNQEIPRQNSGEDDHDDDIETISIKKNKNDDNDENCLSDCEHEIDDININKNNISTSTFHDIVEFARKNSVKSAKDKSDKRNYFRNKRLSNDGATNGNTYDHPDFDPDSGHHGSIFVPGTKMIDPNHPTRQKWDMLGVLTALLYTAIRVPYTIAFDIDEFDSSQFGWFLANRLVDIVFIADMIITFRTAIQDGEHLMIDQKKIAKKYIQTWFIVDLISSVPFDVIFYVLENSSSNDNSGGTGSGVERSAKLLRVFKIVRILRLIKFQRIFLTLEIAMGVNFSIMSIIKFLFSIAMLAHLMACVFAGIDYQSDHNWITESASTDHLSDIDDSIGNSYVAALYWAISTISSVGYGDIAAHTIGERWFSCLAMILGGVTFTYGLTHIVHLVADMNKNESKLFEIMENIEEWAAYYDFPSELLKDIKLYFRYKADFVFANENELKDSLTDSMKRKICDFTNGAIIRNVAMFNNCSESLIGEILLSLHTEFAPPHSLIVAQGSIPDEMFIINKGKVACYRGELDIDAANHNNIVALTKGQSFGEVSFILPNMTRIVNVLALVWCDLLYITKKDFFNLMKYYPSDLKVFEAFAKQKYQSWIHINESSNTKVDQKPKSIQKPRRTQSLIQTHET